MIGDKWAILGSALPLARTSWRINWCSRFCQKISRQMQSGLSSLCELLIWNWTWKLKKKKKRKKNLPNGSLFVEGKERKRGGNGASDDSLWMTSCCRKWDLLARRKFSFAGIPTGILRINCFLFRYRREYRLPSCSIWARKLRVKYMYRHFTAPIHVPPASHKRHIQREMGSRWREQSCFTSSNLWLVY